MKSYRSQDKTTTIQKHNFLMFLETSTTKVSSFCFTQNGSKEPFTDDPLESNQEFRRL